MGLRWKRNYEASHDCNANAARNFLDVEIKVLHFNLYGIEKSNNKRQKWIKRLKHVMGTKDLVITLLVFLFKGDQMNCVTEYDCDEDNEEYCWRLFLVFPFIGSHSLWRLLEGRERCSFGPSFPLWPPLLLGRPRLLSMERSHVQLLHWESGPTRFVVC